MRSVISLYGALKQAVAWELRGRNVLESVKVPKQVKPEVAYRTADEVTRFLAYAQLHRLYGLFYTAVVTGMRRGELATLRWKDVDLIKNRIYVRLNAVDIHGSVEVGEPKTNASRRIIHVQEDDIRVLEHKKRQRDEPTLLGQAWSELDIVFPHRWART